MNWKITLSFILSATLLTILVGWLTINEVLPIQQNIQFNANEQNFIGVWLVLAIAIGLILPGITWLVWLKNPPARKILGFYLFVLLVQIVTEQVFSSIGSPSIVVIIGTVYTVFRLWQLWQGQLIYKTAGNLLPPRLMNSLLWLLELFWFSNLLMLLTLGWSSILS